LLSLLSLSQNKGGGGNSGNRGAWPKFTGCHSPSSLGRGGGGGGLAVDLLVEDLQRWFGGGFGGGRFSEEEIELVKIQTIQL
jgi:uncharacterized protein